MNRIMNRKKCEFQQDVKIMNQESMENIPEDKCICKWCWYCECNEEAIGAAICSLDIGDIINVNDDIVMNLNMIQIL